MVKRKTIVERFWSKVEKGSPESCWLWTASTSGGSDGKSYGGFQVTRGNGGYAHRYSYSLHYGPIPSGMEVMHSCDNGLCVNPHHLSVGTRKQNMEDAVSRGRLNPYDRRGIKNSNCKLTLEQVDAIKKALSDGYTQDSIAKEFSISQSIISDIKLGKWGTYRGG